ncbi:hypothetical protein C0J52_22666 [Blattella germanica]|nr:hypothetical protein C0J52_22666 [Blattella germanica]
MDDSLMMNSLPWDISDLARHLRQERLFVSSEQQHLQGLNEKVISGSTKLAKLAWVTAQQRDNLNRLVVARPDCTPAACLRKANTLDNTIFVDGYKVLGFQISKAGDRLVPEMMHGTVHSIVAGLFGSSLLPEDMLLALRLLRHLTEIQLVPSDDPRRLLRQRSCAFARLYGEFHESLFSAKLFLTAALHQPIMQLLVEDEMFLDIDPDKATVRFPPEERLKKFGPEGSPEYNIRLQEYRKWTNSCLVAVTNRFVNAICTDLVFTYFICPAIVNPEPYGITDAPISYISRFNLIQVAKIVQMLAMTKFEDVDSKVSDLYNLFEKVAFLQAVAGDENESGEIKKQVAALLVQLPLGNTTVNGHSSTNAGLKPQPPTTPSTPRKGAGLLGKVSKARVARSSSSPASSAPAEGTEETGGGDDESGEQGTAYPLVPSVQQVLCMEEHSSCGESQVRVNLPDRDERDGEHVNVVERGESHEKRTRFSLSHDEGSIGNTSDNLEAVSEAASNHSVASSLELENDQNDNLSDMVSANVSGRGTPNISGRDTPSSQITEGEEGPGGVLRGSAGEPRQSLDFPPPPPNKQSRTDIDDKFGKFEIKKLLEGSVARSDDTARSEVEVEGRGEPEGGEDAPSSNAQSGVGLGFRPIREDPIGRASLLAPASPTRVDGGSHPAWNVTGRGGGKADYRRRTVEYVDNNANNPVHRGNIPGSQSIAEETRLIHVIDKIDKPPDLKPAVVAASQASVSIVHIPGPLTLPALHNGPIAPTPPLPQNGVLDPAPVPTVNTVPLVHIQANHTSAQNDAVAGHIHPHLPSTARHVGVGNPANMDVDLKPEVHGEEETDRDSVDDVIPNLPLAPTALVMNGHATMADGEVPIAKSVTLSQSTSSSTGAIPKSISFDKTAERGDKINEYINLEVLLFSQDLLDEDQKHKRGFFRNFKLPFKSRRVKTIRGSDEFNNRYESSLTSGDGDVSHLRMRRGMSEDSRPTHNCNDTTEDILAKYRRKPSASGDSTASEPGVDLKPPQLVGEVEDERLSMDPANIEASYAFADAKRKLRMVLSTADLQHVPWVPESASHVKDNWGQKENELVSFLQLQLAEAINLQDRSLIAHLHETLRCIRLFDDAGCQKLFKSLEGDYQKRSPYIAYLVRCRQGLLSTLAHLERLIERLKCDRQVCSRFLVAVCVTMFLEKREQMLSNFTAEFQQLTLADEKTDFLDNFLQTLSLEMDRDPTWQAASSAQLEQAHTAVERAIISRVYTHALYPNGDGDVSRDQVLHEHMKKLSNVITPNHKDLRIPKMFHYECPWPSAQAEVSAMAAYKTPSDKLQCVFRCATTIMNLLSLACERGVPAADDFVPVLVYANPPSLLSTVQYVNSFYGSRLEGEEQYWWIQFCSAIEFIKTMDYSD